MLQEPTGGVPGVDLTFRDGHTGRLWGVCAFHDAGRSFEKAASALRRRAETIETFDWLIRLEFEFVVTTAFAGLIRLVKTLDELVAERSNLRSVTVEAVVASENENIVSLVSAISSAVEAREWKHIMWKTTYTST